MRFILLCCAALLAPLTLQADDLKIVRTWPGYRTAESFMRVSEYFTGRENSDGETYLRTQPKERAGYYFLSRVKNSGAAMQEAQLTLQVITAKAPSPVTFSFKVEVPRGQHVFQVGLTGSDWAGAGDNPVAWHLSIADSTGRVLVTDQSYLWSKPDRS